VDTTQILKIQNELAQRTLDQPDARHKRLYRLVCDAGWLRTGLDAILQNKGRSTPGIDGMTKDRLDADPEGRDKLVQQLRQELLTGNYRPQPVRRVYIPKANGKTRPLGIATLRDRTVQAAIKMVLEPIYESVFHRFSWGFRPLRSTHQALSGVRQGLAQKRLGSKWIIEGDISACFDEIDHRLLRRFLKKRIQDDALLDLITKMLRCGIAEDGQISYPQRGVPQGSICSPLLANVFLHEFDDWYVRTYRLRPEWLHRASSTLQYHRKKEIGGTLMFTRYADDWVAVWNGSRERAEEIKGEIKTFLAEELKLRLSEEKTLITHVDDGFDFLGYRLVGSKRWSDGRWCVFTRVPSKAIRRFRDNIKKTARNVFADEAAVFTALASLIRGWGNYYAYAAESRLMSSLDAFVYHETWKYCRRKNARIGARAVYLKYTLPPPLRQKGYLQLGLVVGKQVVRIPCLSSIPRKRAQLTYPPHPYLVEGQDSVLPNPGTTDEPWWEKKVWTGYERTRTGQKRLAIEVLNRDVTCRICGKRPAEVVHHSPAWSESFKHEAQQAIGVCRECHQQLHSTGSG
jgi:group II intron reverse transcriptase/maturase